MLMPPAPEDSIVQAIQLSVSPVFLLSAIGVTLSVLTNRLSRIVDRLRALEEKPDLAIPEHRKEIARLHLRSRHINIAITLCVTSALLVCSLIATIFLGQLLQSHSATAHSSTAIAILFVICMIAFIGSLLFFLFEILIATKFLRH